ncbi:MAG: hypothetical protein O3A84_04545, partial [Proteobacteria bacterium]|nr:hypothetical protein [Pseudomonadota bacterium]
PQLQPSPEPLTASEPTSEASAPDETPAAHPQSFDDVIALAAACGEHVLRAQLVSNVRLVRFEPARSNEAGRIEFSLAGDAPKEMVNELHRFLNANASGRWVATLSQASGADTLRQQAENAIQARKQAVADHPMVQAIMETFPGSEIETVRDITPPRDGGDALPLAASDDDDGDGFTDNFDDSEDYDLGETL